MSEKFKEEFLKALPADTEIYYDGPNRDDRRIIWYKIGDEQELMAVGRGPFKRKFLYCYLTCDALINANQVTAMIKTGLPF